ncbi:hypothetical protein JCM10450v2_008313 [Rhodotorula kratochvilovae]
MLPTSSPRFSSPHLIDDIASSRRLSLDSLPAPVRRALSHPVALRLRTYKQQHPRRTLALLGLAALAAGWGLVAGVLAFLDARAEIPYGHSALAWGTHPDAVVNWGDYVGLGHQRAKVLAGTPQGYADIGDWFPRLEKELAGPLYRRRRSAEEKARGDEPQDLSEGRGRKASGGAPRDRHGVLGGASVEWSTGVIGSGTWLGPGVDMRKDGSSAPASLGDDDAAQPASSAAAMMTPGHVALTEHIVEKGWVFLDEEDRANTAKLQAEAHDKDFFETLPLRERVRGDPAGMREAAEGWARVYAAMDTPAPKSALEVQLERMVRRVPVVVFSKTTCPYSKRAKERLKDLDLYPAVHVVEVDLRPDMPQLKGLLKRRTNHSTWPSIIIGSRSIGGSDDLERLLASGELGEMLEEVGVKWSGP